MLTKRFNLSRSYEIRLSSPDLFEGHKYQPFNGGYVYVVVDGSTLPDTYTAVSSANLFKWAKQSELDSLGEEPIQMLPDPIPDGLRAGVPFRNVEFTLSNLGDYSACTPIEIVWKNTTLSQVWVGNSVNFKYPMDGAVEDYTVKVTSPSCSSTSDDIHFQLSGSAPSNLDITMANITVLEGSCNDSSIVKGVNALIAATLGTSNDGIITFGDLEFSIQGTTYGTVQTSSNGVFTIGDLNVPTNTSDSVLNITFPVQLIGSELVEDVELTVNLMTNGDIDQDFLANNMDVGIWDQSLYTLYFNEPAVYTITEPTHGGEIPTNGIKYRITWTQANDVDGGVRPTNSGTLQNFGQEYQFTPGVEAMGDQMVACVEVVLPDCPEKSIDVNCISFFTEPAPLIWTVDGSDGAMSANSTCTGAIERNIPFNINITGGTTSPQNRFTPHSDVAWKVTLPSGYTAKIGGVWINGPFHVGVNTTIQLKTSSTGVGVISYQATVALDHTVLDTVTHTKSVNVAASTLATGWAMTVNGAASNTPTATIKGQPIYYKITSITRGDGSQVTSGAVARVVWHQSSNYTGAGAATSSSPLKTVGVWHSQATSTSGHSAISGNVYFQDPTCPARSGGISQWETRALAPAYTPPAFYRTPLADERFTWTLTSDCMGYRKYLEPPPEIHAPNGQSFYFGVEGMGIHDYDGNFRWMEVWIDLATDDGYEGKSHCVRVDGGGTFSGGVWKMSQSQEIRLKTVTNGVSMFKSRIIPEGKPTHGTKWVTHTVYGTSCPMANYNKYYCSGNFMIEVDNNRFGAKLVTEYGGHPNEGQLGVNNASRACRLWAGTNKVATSANGHKSGIHFEVHFPPGAYVSGGASKYGISALGGSIFEIEEFKWIEFYIGGGALSMDVRVFQVAHPDESQRSGTSKNVTIYDYQDSPASLRCSYRPQYGASFTMAANPSPSWSWSDGKQYPRLGQAKIFQVTSGIPLTWKVYGGSPTRFYGFGWVANYYWFGFDSSLPVLVDNNGNGPMTFIHNKGRMRLVLAGLEQEYITTSLMKFCVKSTIPGCSFGSISEYSLNGGGAVYERWPSNSGVFTSTIPANPSGRPTITFTVTEPGMSVPSGYERLLRVYYTTNTGNTSASLSASGRAQSNRDIHRIPPGSSITLSPPGPNCVLTLRMEWGYFNAATNRYHGKANQVTRAISYT